MNTRAVVALAACLSARACIAGEMEVSHVDGGPATLKLAFGVELNKGSSLRRDWISVNDPECPVQVSAGIFPEYKTERLNGSYLLSMQGTVKATVAIQAYDVVFVLFDVWGQRMKNLRHFEVSDKPAGSAPQLAGKGSWYGTELESSEFLTSVAYVRQVRLPDGKIWKADLSAISEKLRSIQLKISEQSLEAVPDKK